jgi:tRNA (guanine-N(7)-)-methyltransferase
MRKAGRLWRNPEARAAAAQVMVPDRTDCFVFEPLTWFGREARLELEIGAGRGDFIVERAAANPECDFLAIESATQVAQLMAVRAGRRGVANLRVLRMDARSLVNLILPTRQLSACHIYFPDPWPKDRHVKHRLFTPYFAHSLRRVLAPDASLYVATDVGDYAVAIFAMLEAAGFMRTACAVPGATATGFARKFIEAGREIFAATFVLPRNGDPRDSHPTQSCLEPMRAQDD